MNKTVILLISKIERRAYIYRAYEDLEGELKIITLTNLVHEWEIK